MVKGAVQVTKEVDWLGRISVSAPPWATAATMLLIMALPSEVRQTILVAGWLDLPIEHWVQDLKDFTELMRRSGMLGMIKSDHVYSIRKIFNVTCRNIEEADWAGEDYRRTSWCVPKRVPFNTLGQDGNAAWVDLFVKSVERTAKGMIESLRRDRREPESLQDWWERRHHWAPTGSSSFASVMAQDFEDDRFRAGDRLNKKAVMEFLDTDFAWACLTSEPVEMSRTSTKHEPGGKNRALIAADETTFIVTAYASVNMEKAMDFNGLLGKQLPADTLNWSKAHLDPGGYWYSLDYSDFNIEHAKWEMGLSDAIFASTWLQTFDPRVARDKALAALWSSRSYDNAWYRRGEEWLRITNGLSSGSRDTLRNNNIMHRAYSDAAVHLVRALGYQQTILYEEFVGDDEDRKTGSYLDAITYDWATMMCGHQVNPKKQLAGTRHHEFLQRMHVHDEPPSRPLAMVLATLASGNWYAEGGLWYDSVINSTSNNWWEAATRGLPVDAARKLAGYYLDHLMQVEKGKRAKGEKAQEVTRLKKLEWWVYRHGNGEVEHPLWANTIGQKLETVNIVSKAQPRGSWPSKATDDWMKHLKPILSQLRASRTESYRNYLLQESIGGSFHHHRQRTLRDVVAEEWPVRRNNEKYLRAENLGAAINAPSLREVVDLARCMKVERRPFTQEELEARLGLDSYLVKQVGGTLDLYSKVPASRWNQYTEIVPRPVISQRFQGLESSVRAFFSQYAWANPVFSLPPKNGGRIKMDAPLLYVLMGAASGKSYLAARYRKVAEVDTYVYATTGWGNRLLNARKAVGLDSAALQPAFSKIVAEGCKVILGQWPIAIVQKVASRMVPPLNLHVVIYEPGEEVRRVRLLQRSNWNEERVQRYFKEFRKLADVAGCELQRFETLEMLLGHMRNYL